MEGPHKSWHFTEPDGFDNGRVEKDQASDQRTDINVYRMLARLNCYWSKYGLTYVHLLNQGASVAAVWFGIRRDHNRCRYAVAGLHVQQADALGVAAGFADGGRVHADDFAVVADQHDFGGFVDLRDGDDFAYALGGLDVDHTFAAAIRQAVFVGGSPFAVAVFGD